MKKEKKHNFPDGGNLIFGFKYKCAYIIKQGFYFYFLVAVILLLVKKKN